MWGLIETFWRGCRFLVQKLLRLSRYFRIKFYKYNQKVKNPGYAFGNVNGFKMFLDLKNDSGISKELYIFGKREHDATNFILSSNLVKEGDVVLDIGANIGYYALIWSKLIGDNGKVYALEPVKNNFRMLVKNINLNDANNITPFNIAAGRENKKEFINVAKAGNISSFFNKEAEITGKEEVDLIKIDDFLKDKEYPTLVRMDVEGYAGEILKGMKNTLKTTKYLLIEIHPHIKNKKQKEEFASILMDNGFKVEKIFIDINTGMSSKGLFPLLINFINKRIYKSKRMQQRLENINKEENLEMIFEEGGYNILFSRDEKR